MSDDWDDYDKADATVEGAGLIVELLFMGGGWTLVAIALVITTLAYLFLHYHGAL